MRKSNSQQKAQPERGGDESAVLKGYKIVAELIGRRSSAIQKIFVSAERADSVTGGLAKLLDRATELSIPILFGDTTNTDRGGVSALLHPTAPVPLEAVLATDSAIPLIIGLDGVTDPQNLGAIFRMADAVGAKGIFTSRDRSCPLSAVVRRVSSGASEFVNISYVNNFASAIRELKKEGYWVVGSALVDSATDLYETTIPPPVCLLLGSEGEGLRRLSLELCDIVVKIPMNGVVGSLNVSQAGSILAFEILRRIRAESKNEQ